MWENIKNVIAVCAITSGQVKGVIYLDQHGDTTVLSGSISGLKPGQAHAIHIHEYGDLTEGCSSCCAHYNPHKMNHGGPESFDRHVGDLGNIIADSNGVAKFEITDHLVKLSGPFSVIGRSIVIHEDPDDLGLGGHSDSLTTGHAGASIALL